jgi:PAS domain S-box-containing protein
MSGKQQSGIGAQFAKAEDILDILNDYAIVSVADTGGRILFANDRFCKISGYSRDELIGSDHAILNSGRHEKGFFREMWRTIADGRIWRGIICNRRSDGSLYWVKTIIKPFCGADGTVEKYISMRVEVTEEYRLRAELETHLNKALNVERYKAQFLSMISHEVRTPLNSIKGFAELIGHLGPELSVAQLRDYVAGIAESAERLNSVIEDIEFINGPGSLGDDQARREHVFVQPETERCVHEFVRGTEESFVLPVHVTAAPPDARVLAVRTVFSRVLQEILNFVHFEVSAASQVDIHWHVDPGQGTVCLSIDVPTEAPLDDNLRHFGDFGIAADLQVGKDRIGRGYGMILVRKFIEVRRGRFRVDMADPHLFGIRIEWPLEEMLA